LTVDYCTVTKKNNLKKYIQATQAYQKKNEKITRVMDFNESNTLESFN
jgi:hypothetical protein